MNVEIKKSRDGKGVSVVAYGQSRSPVSEGWSYRMDHKDREIRRRKKEEVLKRVGKLLDEMLDL